MDSLKDTNTVNEMNLSCFKSIIQAIPVKWFEKVESIMDDDGTFLMPKMIQFLKKNIPINCKDFGSKLDLFSDWIGQVLNQQIDEQILSDVLTKRAAPFLEQRIGNIVSEFIELFELEWGAMGITSLLPIIFRVTNACSKHNKAFSRLTQGITESCKKSKFPLQWMQHGCNFLQHIELMAILCETAIDKFLENNSIEKSWKHIQSSLNIPDNEESTFIRYCLSHGLVRTLVAHASSRLSQISNNNFEYRVMIGEQVGIWIESLNLEAIPSGLER
jgi:hypothetical protein